MSAAYVIANGEKVETCLPVSLYDFLVSQSLLPRSVVVEHNGQAVSPSQFSKITLTHADRLEVVKVVAGG